MSWTWIIVAGICGIGVGLTIGYLLVRHAFKDMM